MKTSNELLNELVATQAITEEAKLIILKAIEVEKCDAIISALDEVKVNLNNIKNMEQ